MPLIRVAERDAVTRCKDERDIVCRARGIDLAALARSRERERADPFKLIDRVLGAGGTRLTTGS